MRRVVSRQAGGERRVVSGQAGGGSGDRGEGDAAFPKSAPTPGLAKSDTKRYGFRPEMSAEGSGAHLAS